MKPLPVHPEKLDEERVEAQVEFSRKRFGKTVKHEKVRNYAGHRRHRSSKVDVAKSLNERKWHW